MRLLFVLLLFYVPIVVLGQDTKLVPVKQNTVLIKGTDFLGYDGLNAIYMLNNNELIKEFEGIKWFYKNPILGKISHVDLQNPLKIVVFFQDFNTIVLLDNQLNETQKINFSENNDPILALAIGLASNNRVWIYNDLNQKIGLFDYTKKDIQYITVPFPDNVKEYQTTFNHFQWIDGQTKGYSCDVFGNITTIGKVPDFDQLQWVSADTLLYKKDDLLYVYSSKTANSAAIDLGEKTFKNFTYKDQILSIFTDQGITNYKIILP